MAGDEGDLWTELEGIVDKIPFVAGLKRDLSNLRNLVYHRRAPKLVTVAAGGVRGDLLIRGLLGEHAPEDDDAPLDGGLAGSWLDLSHEERLLRWLPLEAGQRLRSLEEPDLALVLIDIKSISEEGRANETFDAIRTSLRSLRDLEKKPPVFAVLVCEEDPESLPSQVASQAFEKALKDRGHSPKALFAVELAPASGLVALSEALAKELPAPAKIEGGRSLVFADKARQAIAADVIRCCSTLSVTVALTPIPFSDIVFLAPVQGIMVTSIAYLGGRSWDRRSATEWITSLGVVGGAGMGMRWGAQQIVKLVPGMGSIVSAGVAGSGTLALGRSAVRYFLPDRKALPVTPA